MCTLLNLIGEKFGLLTVISRAENSAFGAVRWNCQCACGKIKAVERTNLKSGHVLSCGGPKCRLNKKNSMVGLTFGKLTVIESLGFAPGNGLPGRGQIVRASCSCGGKWTGTSNSLRTGNTKSCGCLPTGNKGFENRERSPINKLHGRYKRSARTRGHCWELSTEQFEAMIKLPCHYCGAPPGSKIKTRTGAFAIYTGIDRRDNLVGYSVINSVPCCGVCNYAKRALPDTVFLNHIKKIYEHSIKPNEYN